MTTARIIAGITAANKIEGSSVIGVGCRMPRSSSCRFSAGGGAGWDTIMAGLEDCVRLDVDACNLSSARPAALRPAT